MEQETIGGWCRLCVLVSRFCLAAWAGAALFFALSVVSLRQSSLFDDATKLNHPRVLFSLYYPCEFVLLGLSLATGIAARHHPAVGGARFRTHLFLVAAALLLALADVLWIYAPLKAMLALAVMPPEFRALHRASMGINAVEFVLCVIASLLALWPGERPH